jgi:hypothetical protein
MDPPARRRVDELLQRVFPAADEEDPAGADPSGTDAAADDDASRSVDERRQRLLEPLGDPDRESW